MQHNTKWIPCIATKLMDGVRQTLRLHHYSYETEKVYSQWIPRLILFHDKRHAKEIGAIEIQSSRVFEFQPHVVFDGDTARTPHELSPRP